MIRSWYISSEVRPLKYLNKTISTVHFYFCTDNYRIEIFGRLIVLVMYEREYLYNVRAQFILFLMNLISV